uniref:Uncharacterized protein n=1 Tax=Anguilla anguilla TaxID=7936 RepID=A0A0E9R1Z6_ANGAN
MPFCFQSAKFSVFLSSTKQGFIPQWRAFAILVRTRLSRMRGGFS